MPSRPVLIGRGLVTTPPTHHRVHIQNLNQQTTGSPRYGGHSDRETPGPIPNPEVKPASANGTATDRLWESRTPPNTLTDGGHLPMAPIASVGVLSPPGPGTNSRSSRGRRPSRDEQRQRSGEIRLRPPRPGPRRRPQLVVRAPGPPG